MPHIVQLPTHLADLIAAGEVVERPASVVKELIENSIDAGAATVTVEIQNGGIRFLRVTDDGCGMSREDAPIAFLRHATSKIRTEQDLEAIGTLGFRGEALAATAAVSRIDLLTKTQASLAGVSLHLEAGQILRNEEAGCPDGTTIIVRDLFYNTPARMKFLKRDSAEGAAVFSAVQKQALAHPEIAFRFLRDGKQELQTAGDGQLLGAIYSTLGRTEAKDMLSVQSKWQNIQISGFVSRPTATRGNRGYQHFFLNGRYIRNRMLSMALEEAYKNQMMVGRFPACVLHITMPKEVVDVNVHPAKTEVKFLSDRELFDAIYYAVLAVLRQAPGKVDMELPQKKTVLQVAEPDLQPAKPMHAAPQAPKSSAFQTMSLPQYRALQQSMLSTREVQPRQGMAERVFSQKKESLLPKNTENSQAMTGKSQSFSQNSQDFSQPIAQPASQPIPQPDPKQQKLPLAEPDFRIVGEVLATYIIVEQGGEVLFIDKHAAHERINFERLKKNQQPIMGQLLLSPVRCSLNREEAEVVLQNKPLLAELGFDVDDLGAGTVVLRQIPADTTPEEAEAELAELAAALLSGKRLDPQALRDSLYHVMACKAAIKAGWHTEPAEREALVRQVLGRDDLKYCPHGRPICMRLTKQQIEKQFKRT